nr:uncharacterized protein LOC127305608 [Lolium perenne]
MEDDAAAAAAAVSKVLADDDLLTEILLRVGFPTTLVRAAAVCKRWLHHASHKAFLRRFRKLNPPRLLGFYTKINQGAPRFVPMLPPQPPELAAAVRIVGGYRFPAGPDGVMSEGYSLGVDGESLFRYEVSVHDCRNGSVSTVLCGRRRRGSRYESRRSIVMHSPLCPERAIAIDRPLSPHHQHPNYGGSHDYNTLQRRKGRRFISLLCDAGEPHGVGYNICNKFYGTRVHLERWSLVHACLGHDTDRPLAGGHTSCARRQ